MPSASFSADLTVTHQFAYQRDLALIGKPTNRIDQFNGYSRISGDPHPENKFLLVGTIGNMPEFQSAFACARNAPMVRPDRCQTW